MRKCRCVTGRLRHCRDLQAAAGSDLDARSAWFSYTYRERYPGTNEALHAHRARSKPHQRANLNAVSNTGSLPDTDPLPNTDTTAAAHADRVPWCRAGHPIRLRGIDVRRQRCPRGDI